MKIELAMLKSLEREEEIPLEELAKIIEQAVHTAYFRHLENRNEPMPEREAVRVFLDRKTGEVSILQRELNSDGELVEESIVTTEEFGRITANAAKQVINQRLRALSDDQVLGVFRNKEGQILAGTVQQSQSDRMVHIDLGGVEALLPPEEQVPGEEYTHGKRLRVIVTRVTKGVKGPQIIVSRSHPGLVRKLFEMEVPEIVLGYVEIVSLAREAGYRTKIAVRATQPGINAKGTCIGEMGRRVRSVMAQLGDERIDIVDYSPVLTEFVANALSPAKVSEVFAINADQKKVRALVPDFQLSLAIGREGQNARLAAKLTGAKIDIQPDSVMEE